MKATLKELADLVGGDLRGDPKIEVGRMASLEEAQPGEITFLASPKDSDRLEKTRATAAVVPLSLSAFPIPVIRTSNPYLAYARIQALFTRKPQTLRGIDPRAFIGKGVKMGSDVSIFPFAYIGDESEIGDRAVIHPGVFIGESVQVGEETILYPNVVILDRCLVGKRVILHAGTVIGSDGFGFARDGAHYVKIPQVGIVQVDDDVEIGANCTIDRAAMGKTWIKRGVKTDNLVQIAHNVTIGEDTVIVAQVGIAGSTEIGNRVALGGQVGVVGHIKIGDGAMIGAQAGVGQRDSPRPYRIGEPGVFPSRMAQVPGSLPETSRDEKKLGRPGKKNQGPRRKKVMGEG